MSQSPRVIAATLFTAVLFAHVRPVSAQQGPLNEAGRAVKRGFQTAGQAVSGGLQTAGQAMTGGFQKSRTNVHNMEVVSRVYSRIHWDKALTGATVEIEVQSGGVTILTGVVPSEEAKLKVLTLTSETVGVNEVIDQLTVLVGVRPARVIPGAVPTVVIPAPASAPVSTIIVTPPATVVPPASTTKVKETDIPL